VHARALGPTDPDPSLDLLLIRVANTLADKAATPPPDPEAAAALRQMVDQQQARLAQRHAAALGIKLPPAMHQLTAGAAAPAAAAAAAAAAEPEVPRNSCVVQLANMVEREELLDDEEYAEILQDTRGEVAKYGQLRQVAIPQPARDPGAWLGWAGLPAWLGACWGCCRWLGVRSALTPGAAPARPRSVRPARRGPGVPGVRGLEVCGARSQGAQRPQLWRQHGGGSLPG
jgi:hypothetical protein